MSILLWRETSAPKVICDLLTLFGPRCWFKMSSVTEQNTEYQSLVQFADELTQLIQHNVVSLSSKLFANSLVAKDVHDSVLSVDGSSKQSKAATLLSCVLDKIKESTGRFQDFIDILCEDSYFEHVALKIKQVHGKHPSK